jgi:HlyD family secretion protein
MTANVKILVNPLENVLKVPNAALRYHPTGSEKAVWILDQNKPRRVVVTTGETDGTFTQVTQSELKDGDRVIIAALDKTAPASGNSRAVAGGRGPGF